MPAAATLCLLLAHPAPGPAPGPAPVLLPWWGATGPALAPEPAASSTQDRIDTLVEEGTGLYEAEDYVGAVAKFQAAYELDPDPNFLYNIGRTYEEAAQLQEAVDYYRRFAQQPGIALELRKQAVERIKVLDEVLAQTRPATVPAVDEPSPSSPTPGESQSETTPPSSPSPGSVPTDEEPTRPGRGLRISGYTLLGVGLSMVAGGAVAGGLARRDSTTLERTDDPQTRVDLIDQGRRKALAADVLLIAGGVVTATGLTLALVGMSRGRTGRRAAVVPALGPAQAGASLHLRF